MILKCPYCFEHVTERTERCPHCLQYVIDEFLEADYPSVDKKNCIFCGKKISTEAKFCRFCRRWVDEIDRAAGEVDPGDLV